MKKQYTKQQIKEAIDYWQKQLNSKQYKIINERKMTRQELDDFYKLLNNGKVKFEYIKKDGTSRSAIGTLNPKLMPSEQEIINMYKKLGIDYDDLMQNLQDKKDYMPYYWDLDKGGYRKFHVSRFVKLDNSDNDNDLKKFIEQFKDKDGIGRAYISKANIPCIVVDTFDMTLPDEYVDFLYNVKCKRTLHQSTEKWIPEQTNALSKGVEQVLGKFPFTTNNTPNDLEKIIFVLDFREFF